MAKQTFTSGQVLTAAQMTTLQANDYNQTVSTKTASYTLVAADAGTKIVMNSASATTITVNTSLFTAGDTLTVLNIGLGVCTITAGTATVSTTTNGSLALTQYGGGILYFTSAGVSVFQTAGVTAPTTAFTSGSQSSTSTSYVDLATVTSVTVTTGTSALVVATAVIGSSTVNTSDQMSYAVSGATTIAAGANGVYGAFNQSNTATFMGSTVTIFYVHTNLTAGSNTFTLKYSLNIAGTMTATDRRITVFPL